jgi:HSP20 family protein
MFKPLEPFKELTTLQERINKMFEDVLPSFSLQDSKWLPAVDIYETDGNIQIEVEVPGMDEKNLKVKIEDNTLTISGDRKFEKKESKDNYYRIERNYGSFTRSFFLPDNVDKEQIKAKYENGILKVELPKKSEAKPKEIEIAVQKQS